MVKLKNKAISLFVAVLLIASTFTVLTTTSPSNAADYTVTTKAFLSARPTSVGVGQEAIINIWMSPAPGANRQYHGYEITVTDPDGKETPFTLNSYVADGTNWCPWVFDKEGDWTIDFYYPGEYFAPGRYIEGELSTATTGGTNYADGINIKSATARSVTIHVQSEPVSGFPDASLPTGYWTWPIVEENRAWWQIAGGYPWVGSDLEDAVRAVWDELYPDTNTAYNSAYGFTPWVSGPVSAHIVWKRPYQMAGLMGGDYGQASSTYVSIYAANIGQPVSFLADVRMAPSVVLMGRAYHTIQKPGTNSPTAQTYWECYDIVTGEVYWERPLFPGETAPTIIEYSAANLQVPGEQAKPETPALISISNGYLRKYNPTSGLMFANVSIAPMTGSGGTYYKNGLVLGIQDLGAAAGSARYRLINWTTQGASNFASRVISNTTYQRNALPTGNLIDWDVGIGCTVSGISQGGIYVGMDLRAFDLWTGAALWNKTIDEPIFSNSANLADHGKLAVISAKGCCIAFDLKNGKEVWRTKTLDYPWDEPGWGAYCTTSAYGQIFWSAQTGIYAIDWATGNINWKFEKEAPPFETPYTGSKGQTVYPFAVGSVCADGKLYAYSQEHTPEQPFYRGAPTVCIDVFTGEEVWSIGMSGMIFIQRGELVVAGGHMMLASREGVMYTFGKGLSETTLSTPQLAVPFGQKALLTGTVLDLSPAQPGVPCVAKESVAAQMEHIHLQVGVGGVLDDVPMVGVPVVLYVHDPNGNDVYLDTVISDGYSGTFMFNDWIPQDPGVYTITATFLGDESYGMSSATAYLTVAEGEAPLPVDNTLLYALIGATIAIIITIVLVGFIFRKK